MIDYFLFLVNRFSTRREVFFLILENVKRLCKQKQTSIWALEKALGIGNGTISKWETSSPSVDKLKRVADYFGVTVDDLLREVK